MSALPVAAVVPTVGPDGVSLVRMRMPGDAMRPTIDDGDELVVDVSDTRVTSSGGVFVIDADGVPIVRRLVLTDGGAWAVLVDNRLYRDREVRAGSARVLGRVVASLAVRMF